MSIIVKPSVSFLNDDSDPQLIVDTHTILAGMTNNPGYATPAPDLTAVQTALNDFTTALANAADGGITLTAIKNAKRAELVTLLRALASYVQVTCAGNLTILLSSGFPTQKPVHAPVGIPPAPGNLILLLGLVSGELDAGVTPVNNAVIYNWKLMAAGQTAVLQTAQSTAASYSFSGLTPGAVYTVQVNAVTSAGIGDWSDPVSRMVT